MPHDQPPKASGAHLVVLQRSNYPECLRIKEILRKETVGGILLLSSVVASGFGCDHGIAI